MLSDLATASNQNAVNFVTEGSVLNSDLLSLRAA